MKPAKFVMFPVARLLRTENGLLDVSANNRDGSLAQGTGAYSKENLDRLFFKFREAKRTMPEIGNGTGIQVPIQVRIVPAPEWQKELGTVGQIAKGHIRTLYAIADGIEKIPAMVFEDMDNDTFTAMVADHGSEEGLDWAGVYATMEKLVLQGWDDRRIVGHTLPMQESLSDYTPKARERLAACKTIDEKIDYLATNTFRGRLQKARHLANVPFLMRDLMFESIRTGSSWPLNKDLQTASSLHDQDEVNPDRSRNEGVTRSNPGPRFLEFWGRLMEAKAKAKDVGEKTPKGVSMLTREKTEALFDSFEARIPRVSWNAVLNKSGYTREALTPFFTEVLRIETQVIGEELMTNLIKLLPAPPSETVVSPKATPPASGNGGSPTEVKSDPAKTTVNA